MICAIVLAAGESRRMGVQKLLLPFGSKTVITHIVDQLTASSVDEVHVVVGCHGERVSRELSDRPVSIVNNSNYKSGMLSSVRCGINAITQKYKAVLVALGDQPSVTTKLIDRMLQTFVSTEKQILVPLYQGKRGHPIMFSSVYHDEIMTHYDNIGLRGLLYAHKDDIFELFVATSGVLSDMDYPEDYQRELGLLEEKKEDEDQAK
jgi:molybdenum cofactor cytidylyltransferase